MQVEAVADGAARRQLPPPAGDDLGRRTGADRGKFLDGLVRACKAGQLRFGGAWQELAGPAAFAKMRDSRYRTAWVVDAKRPFGAPRVVIASLSRCTHRVAISDARVRAVGDDCVVDGLRVLEGRELRGGLRGTCLGCLERGTEPADPAPPTS